MDINVAWVRWLLGCLLARHVNKTCASCIGNNATMFLTCCFAMLNSAARADDIVNRFLFNKSTPPSSPINDRRVGCCKSTLVGARNLGCSKTWPSFSSMFCTSWWKSEWEQHQKNEFEVPPALSIMRRDSWISFLCLWFAVACFQMNVVALKNAGAVQKHCPPTRLYSCQTLAPLRWA